MEKKNRTIMPLQYLRVLMMFLVCFEHFMIPGYNFIPLDIGKYLQGGSEGVCFFFMLAGFVMYLSSYDKLKELTFINFMKTIFKKIKKYIPFYYMALGLGAIYQIIIIYYSGNALTWTTLGEIIRNFILNAFFLQVYFVNEAISFNTIAGAGWYLAVLVFCYFMTYFLLRFIRILNEKKIVKKVLFAVILFYYGYTYFVGSLRDVHYFIYIFPLFRLVEYFSGILLAKIYLDRNTKGKNASAFEISSLVLFTISHLIIVINLTNFGLKSFQIYCVTLLLIYVFSKSEGIISKYLTKNKIIDYLVKQSFNIYILHYILYKYITAILGSNIVSVVVDFILIFIISYLYDKLFGKPKLTY